MVQIDAIDTRILTILQDDAQLSMQELGERVGLSPNPCWRRVRRLEEAGVIQRRVAILDAATLGLAVTVFVIIRTSRHDADWYEQFSNGVRSIPEIVECHRMSGEIDYLLKVVVSDIGHYDRVYKALTATVKGLSDVSSAFSMECIKGGTALDISTAPRGR